MDQTPKWIGLSKTIMGILVAALVSLGPAFGLELGDNPGQFFNSLVDSLVTAASLLFAAYGRLTANKSVSVLPPKKPDA